MIVICRNLRLIAAAMLCVAATGCTSMRVQPAATRIEHVCIRDNPKVQIEDFITVLQSGFQRHSISSEVFSDPPPQRCEFLLNYTARRSWDIVPYMSLAELSIFSDGRQIASAHYHLRGKGGLSLTKFQGTKAKLDPLIDQLLASNAQAPKSERNVARVMASPEPQQGGGKAAVSSNNQSAAERLTELQLLKDQGLITEQEFLDKRQAILSEI